MSRTNTKIAQQLREREADTTKTNIAVQKAGGLASDGSVFGVLDDVNAKYEEKMANLLKFNSKSKQSTKVRNHKTEWMDEQLRLQMLAKKIELAVGNNLDQVISECPDDEALHEVMDCMNGYYNARKKNQNELANQLQNIKEMLKESRKPKKAPKTITARTTMKADQITTSGKNEGSTEAGGEASEIDSTVGGESGNMAVQSIIAELFITLRSDHAKIWKYWQNQESELRASINTTAQALAQDIRKDGIATQDERLRAEFARILTLPANSGDDGASLSGNTSMKMGSSSIVSSLKMSAAENSPSKQASSKAGQAAREDNSVYTNTNNDSESLELELELVMEHWLHKIAVLDKTHEVNVLAKETEKATFYAEVGLPMDTIKQDPYAGWRSTDHDIFVKIYKKAQVTGMQRKAMLDIMRAELPKIAHESILTHEEWYRKMKFIGAKYKDAEALYTTARADMIAQAKVKLHEHRALKLELLQREREAEIHEKHRSEIHARLSELQAQRFEHDQEALALHKQQEAELLAKLRAQEEALQQEKSEKKQQVEQFKALREAAEAQARAAQVEQQKAAQEQLKALIEANRPNVERRAQLVNEKEEQRRQREVELVDLSCVHIFSVSSVFSTL